MPCLRSQKQDYEQIAEYDEYDNYLNSMLNPDDLWYLPSMKWARQLATLAKFDHNKTSCILTKEEFYKLKTKQAIGPIGYQYLFCEHIVTKDPVLLALLDRERANQQKRIATIIFILTRDPRGFEISGFIDYENSLREYKLDAHNALDWKEIFSSRAKLTPTKSDLSFFNWKSGEVFHNKTTNFTPVQLGMQLHFKHIGDRKLIPAVSVRRNDNSNAVWLRSSRHGFVILHDHIIRKNT